MPTSAIIYNAYTSIIKIKNSKFISQNGLLPKFILKYLLFRLYFGINAKICAVVKSFTSTKLIYIARNSDVVRPSRKQIQDRTNFQDKIKTACYENEADF